MNNHLGARHRAWAYCRSKLSVSVAKTDFVRLAYKIK